MTPKAAPIQSALGGLLLGFAASSAGAAGDPLGPGDPVAGQSKAAVCSACHGADGNSANPMWPKIAGQNAPYLARQIHAIKNREGRDNAAAATMVPMVANLSDQDIADLAAYFATQSVEFGKADPGSIERGERLFRGGDPDRGVPACMSCHGPAGRGNAPAAFPLLAGQHPAYTAKQLEAYRSGERTTDPNAMMRDVAQRLSDADIAALAEYLSGLHW